MRRHLFWGWGTHTTAGEVTTQERDLIAALVRDRFGGSGVCGPEPVEAEFELPAPRVDPPASLAPICSQSRPDRLSHAAGKSFGDLARWWQRRVPPTPDVVAHPRDETDVVAVLDWAAGAEVAVVPYGGGSSVVGGVTPAVGDEFRGVVSLDLQRLDQVLDVDAISGTARIQAGVLGPHLEAQLGEHGFTLRHYPQSFEHSSLGGWIATRAGGHFATGRTRIDDWVAGLRMVTPAGEYQSRRLPGTGAGPDPVRWVCGSEGTFGVVTEATMRVQRPPRFRAAAVVRFPSFQAGADAARTVVQAGLQPANLRLLDRDEARTAFAGDGSADLLLLGFESPVLPVDALLDQALELVRDHGGDLEPATRSQGVAGAWRGTFVRMPYYRDLMVGAGLIVETFETAVPWNLLPDLHAQVTDSVRTALAETGVVDPAVTCRLTYVYPDGAAPYFTVMARGTAVDLAAQWWHVKQAASAAIERCGGTITHHHAVGRDHREWYLREAPDRQVDMLRAAKRAADPRGVMNPGALL